MEHIDIRMLGSFTLQSGDNLISDENNRSRKVWALLAYLICHRGTAVSQKKLIELLWGDDPSSANPENALRITLHRLRSQLDLLWPGAGKSLIVQKTAATAGIPRSVFSWTATGLNSCASPKISRTTHGWRTVWKHWSYTGVIFWNGSPLKAGSFP